MDIYIVKCRKKSSHTHYTYYKPPQFQTSHFPIPATQNLPFLMGGGPGQKVLNDTISSFPFSSFSLPHSMLKLLPSSPFSSYICMYTLFVQKKLQKWNLHLTIYYVIDRKSLYVSCHTLKEYFSFRRMGNMYGRETKEDEKRWTILSFNLRIHIVFVEETKKTLREWGE